MSSDDEHGDHEPRPAPPVFAPPEPGVAGRLDAGAASPAAPSDVQRTSPASGPDAPKTWKPPHDAQRRPPQLHSEAQRTAPNAGPADAQRTEAPLHHPDTQRSPIRDSARSIHRGRPRMAIGLAAGVVAAAAAAVLIVNAQRDEPPLVAPIPSLSPATVTPPATRPTVAVPASTAAAPPVADTEPGTAPATVPTAVAPTPLTALETTTAPASRAGDYDVTVSDITVTSQGQPAATFPPETQHWTTIGACDGIGDCTVALAQQGPSASPSAALLPATWLLSPTAPAIYGATIALDLQSFGCGSGTAMLTLDFHDPAMIVGSYAADIAAGTGECLAFTASANFTAVPAG